MLSCILLTSLPVVVPECREHGESYMLQDVMYCTSDSRLKSADYILEAAYHGFATCPWYKDLSHSSQGYGWGHLVTTGMRNSILLSNCPSA